MSAFTVQKHDYFKLMRVSVSILPTLYTKNSVSLPSPDEQQPRAIQRVLSLTQKWHRQYQMGMIFIELEPSDGQPKIFKRLFRLV